MDSPDPYLEIAKVIRSLRVEFRPVLKQNEMAEALNITQGNYSRLERGERDITLRELIIIAKKLNTTWQNLGNLAERKSLQVNADLFLETLIMVILKQEKNKTISYSKEELDFIITKITTLFLSKNPDMR